MAVDAAGKIYVLASGFSSGSETLLSYMQTFNAIGEEIQPGIFPGPYNAGAVGVAVDASDNLYFTNTNVVTNSNHNDGSVTIFNAAGTLLNTITTALVDPWGVAVDSAGKIYVANEGNNTLTTYTANGTQTTPTITTGLNEPSGVAVDGAGNIYVANLGNGTVTTYTANGTQITTITGLAYPTGIAVR